MSLDVKIECEEMQWEALTIDNDLSIFFTKENSITESNSESSLETFGHLTCRNYDESTEESEEFTNLNQVITTQKESEINFYEEEIYFKKDTTKQPFEKALECRWDGCWLLFQTLGNLVEHIESIHLLSDAKRGQFDEYPCKWESCPRRECPFSARYKLLIHMRVHSGEKPHKCQFGDCGKAFSRLENLKIHQRTHTGERPYPCIFEHCKKAFSNSSDRAKHQRTHFDHKPYGCPVKGCQKKYTDPSSLRKHVKVHEDQSTYGKKKLKASEPIVLMQPIETFQIEQTCSAENIWDALDPRVEQEILEQSQISFCDFLSINDEDLSKGFSR